MSRSSPVRPADRHRKGAGLISVVPEATPGLGQEGTAAQQGRADTSPRGQARRWGWGGECRGSPGRPEASWRAPPHSPGKQKLCALGARRNVPERSELQDRKMMQMSQKPPAGKGIIKCGVSNTQIPSSHQPSAPEPHPGTDSDGTHPEKQVAGGDPA